MRTCARPANAATTNAFCSPILVTHGVMLPNLSEPCPGRAGNSNHSPVSDSKTHCVANENHGHHGFAAQFSVRINAVADGKLKPDGVGETDDTHGKDQAKPLYTVCSSNAPEDQTPGNEKYRRNKEPKTVLRLHDASISSRQPKDEPISYAACI